MTTLDPLGGLSPTALTDATAIIARALPANSTVDAASVAQDVLNVVLPAAPEAPPVEAAPAKEAAA